MAARDTRMSRDTGKQWACICMNPSGVGFGESHTLTTPKSSWKDDWEYRTYRPLHKRWGGGGLGIKIPHKAALLWKLNNKC